MDEETALPMEEWAFQKLMEEQLSTVELDAKESAEEWERCHEWEFTRERILSGRCAKHLENLRSSREEKKLKWDKIATFEGLPRELELREEEWRNRSTVVEDTFFPHYLPEFPETAYLSIPIEKRLEFKELKHEGEKNDYPEMSMEDPGKHLFEIWVDFRWTKTTAKEKFWDWFVAQKKNFGEHVKRTTEHGPLNKKIGELKKLGTVRLMNSFPSKMNSWKKAKEHARKMGNPLYSKASEYSKAKRKVDYLLGE